METPPSFKPGRYHLIHHSIEGPSTGKNQRRDQIILHAPDKGEIREVEMKRAIPSHIKPRKRTRKAITVPTRFLQESRTPPSSLDSRTMDATTAMIGKRFANAGRMKLFFE